MSDKSGLYLVIATAAFLAVAVLIGHFGVKWGFLIPGRIVQ
jgi:hypothetical protein